MDQTLIDNLVKKLQETAAIELAADNEEYFNPDDYAGGNMDDAYEMGVTAGEVYLAREILDLLGVKY